MRKKLSIKEKIIDYVYILSNQPVIFKDLLSANSHYNEKMYVDPGKLGFRMNIIKAYISYFILCAIVIMPLIGITHYFLKHMDFHISIVGSVLVTAVVFIGFDFFRAWIRDAITLKLIKKAWLVHFPYFAYEKYSSKVEKIYNESLKEEVAKRDLQQYVMDKLVEES
ncbi:hypothetical protein [Sulfurospirillum arcachonense]|uniref:hypothetical protein n=1 Tax=Sulfurospirillum arcachonense TaxID=57666 RepID=UPI0004ACE81F|nr:hypothetical protein [Sulfurospirillum arcachonense]